MQLLVTTGATVCFEKLIAFSLSSRFIRTAQLDGFTRLVVQYGISGKDYFISCVQKLHDEMCPDAILEARTNDKEIIFKIADFQIAGVAFDPEFVEKYISQSQLVVSHGGTGSILDVLRQRKRLIVVINTKLAGNHQVEIAKRFQDENLLVYCESYDTNDELEELCEYIGRDQKDRAFLPSPKGKIIGEILADL